MRILILFAIFYAHIFSAVVKESIWRSAETFSDYISRKHIPLGLLKEISPEDMKYVSEIQAGERFYELEENGTLLQMLIPIGEEMQIELFKKRNSKEYTFDIIPIAYKRVADEVSVKIDRNLYSDIDEKTNNPRLGFILKTMYKGSVDFKRLRKGDRVVFRYVQKSRLGKPFGQPLVKSSIVVTGGKKRFAFVDENGNVWHDIKKKIRYSKEGRRTVVITKSRFIKKRNRRFTMPVKKGHITSRFSYKRWHPILHRYRPHLGVDWGAPRGTKIYAVNSGKVIFSGWLGGYGKAVKISHQGGYVSLYAHMSRIKVRKGKYIKRGEIVGYVGSTGRSTGNHLHFGLYLNGKAINPLKVLNKKGISADRVKITTKYKKVEKYNIVKTKTVAIEGAQEEKERLLKILESKERKSYRWDDIASAFIYVKDRKRYENENRRF